MQTSPAECPSYEGSIVVNIIDGACAVISVAVQSRWQLLPSTWLLRRPKIKSHKKVRR